MPAIKFPKKVAFLLEFFPFFCQLINFNFLFNKIKTFFFSNSIPKESALDNKTNTKDTTATKVNDEPQTISNKAF